jgi:hypothetical protein
VPFGNVLTYPSNSSTNRVFDGSAGEHDEAFPALPILDFEFASIFSRILGGRAKKLPNLWPILQKERRCQIVNQPDGKVQKAPERVRDGQTPRRRMEFPRPYGEQSISLRRRK